MMDQYLLIKTYIICAHFWRIPSWETRVILTHSYTAFKSFNDESFRFFFWFFSYFIFSFYRIWFFFLLPQHYNFRCVPFVPCVTCFVPHFLFEWWIKRYTSSSMKIVYLFHNFTISHRTHRSHRIHIIIYNRFDLIVYSGVARTCVRQACRFFFCVSCMRTSKRR